MKTTTVEVWRRGKSIAPFILPVEVRDGVRHAQWKDGNWYPIQEGYRDDAEEGEIEGHIAVG